MKKISNNLGEFISNFTLYFDDIYLIYERLIEASDKITIIANRYELDDINELKDDRFSKITELQLNISNPYVSVEFKDSRIFLYTDSDEYVNVGIYNELKSIINGRRKFKRNISWLSYFIFAPIGIYVGYGLGTNRNVFTPISILIAVLYFFIVSFLNYKYSGPQGKVYSYSSIEKTTFWSRNKDNIILSVGSLVLGSAITLLIQYFL
jgi:hypothetical protein